MATTTTHLQPQPATFTLNLKALLFLPYRLCNPPPAIGKVRSCGVTPVFKVQLEDILDRKHLPPLGLKDFEEWLLFVEQCPENLYFMLWLRDYTARYKQWAIKSKQKPKEKGVYGVSWLAPTNTSPSLAMCYARAKQTFLTPNASYELNVPSDILAPFHTTNFGSPHPDPAVFNEVAFEAQRKLKESLKRFVTASYHNVGTYRATCGIVAGVVFCIAGAVPPIAVNLVEGHSRWLRLLAIPGLWLGLTVLIASLHGVCMMIYIFGDVRQLRKFELQRPSISRPKPLQNTRVTDSQFTTTSSTNSGISISHFSSSRPKQQDFVRPEPPRALTGPPKITIAIPPAVARHDHVNPHSRSSNSSSSITTTVDDSTIPTPVPGLPYEVGFSRRLTSSNSNTDSQCSFVDTATISDEHSFDDDDEDEDGSYEEHGIYISRAYGPDDDVDTDVDLDTAYSEYSITGSVSQDGDVSNAGPIPIPVPSTASFIPYDLAIGDGESRKSVIVSDVVSRKSGRSGRKKSYENGSSSAGMGIGMVKGKRSRQVFDFDALPPRPGNVVLGSASGAGASLRAGEELNQLNPGIVKSAADVVVTTTSTSACENPPSSPSSMFGRFFAHMGKKQDQCTDCKRRRDLEAQLQVVERKELEEPGSPSTVVDEKSVMGGGYSPIEPASASTLGPPSPNPLLKTVDNGDDNNILTTTTTTATVAKPTTTTTLKDEEEEYEHELWRTRFREIQRVPAFGPVTRVLSPVVTRAQWEIVVRSFAVAGGVAWVVVGALLALPEMPVSRYMSVSM